MSYPGGKGASGVAQLERLALLSAMSAGYAEIAGADLPSAKPAMDAGATPPK